MVNGGSLPRTDSEEGTNWDYHLNWKKKVSYQLKKNVKCQTLALYSELGSTLILYIMKHD